MNITLSADPELIRNTRKYAKEHGTSLNKLVRQFMENIEGSDSHENKANEFADFARNHAGTSTPDFVFNREKSHER